MLQTSFLSRQMCHPCRRGFKTLTASSFSIVRPYRRNDTATLAMGCPPKRQFSQQTMSYYLSPDFPPVGCAQKMMETVHEITGLPWWGSIALTTFTLRTVITLPLYIYSTKILCKVEMLQPEIKQTALQLRGEVASAVKLYNWDEKMARAQFTSNMKRLIKKLYIRENCHPMKASIVVIFQLPMWISLSVALRNMAGALPFKQAGNVVMTPDLATGGALWFPNLLLADTTFILPVTMALCNLTVIEINALRKGERSKFNIVLTNVLRGVSIILVPIAATVPSCMSFYWTCSSFYGLAQNIVVRFPSVRRVLGIPKVPSESDTPFVDLYHTACDRYLKKR